MLKENENKIFLEETEFDLSTTISSETTVAVISSVGSAFPATKYTQNEVSDLLGIENKTVRKLLDSGHIKTRHLYFPEPPPGEKKIKDETQEELIEKFHKGVLDIGVRAVENASSESVFNIREMDFLICVTSSGFAVPGLSSMISRALNMNPNLYRLDVVGMGCNAGMSALRTAASLAKNGMKGILLCCEINSAIYVRDESVRTGIVNSLFGDGAVAVVLSDKQTLVDSSKRGAKEKSYAVELLDFESHTISEQWDAMKFDWNSEQKKWSFGLSKDIPFVVGQNLKVPVRRLLKKNSVDRKQIRHWCVHTGGAAVIEGAKKSLSLDEHDVRHTRSVLSNYGNISSGSFLLSLQQLLAESVAEQNDLGVMAAMGPGATLEACLVRWKYNY